MATTKPKALGPFNLGVNNRRAETDLRVTGRTRADSGAFLRAGVNVDVTAEGRLRRRGGYAQVVAGTECHSLWTNAAGTRGFYVDGSDLIEITGAASAPSTRVIRSGMPLGRQVSFAEMAGSVYYTNGVDIGRLDAGAAAALGPQTPNVNPTVSVGAGALPTGVYQLCFSYLDAAGRESATTHPAAVEVGANASITLSGLPAGWPSGVTHMVVGMTAANGSVLMRAFVLAAPAVSLPILSPPTLGARCTTVLLADMPPGHIVRGANGRLLVANGAALYYSEPFAPALRNPAKNYIPFPARVTLVEPCERGVYVAADRTYWLAGDIAAAELLEVLPYGAVEGTGCASPDRKSAWWMSPRGTVIGNAEGAVENVQEKNLVLPRATHGASLFAERDGMKQALASLFNPHLTPAAARSYMDAEIVRKETVL